jgi:hypothetical protein
MTFVGFKRERNIRRVLRSLAGQRVVLVLKPGNVWVIENSPSNLPDQEEAISTCLIRGWIEVLHEAIPQGQLTAAGLPDLDKPFKGGGTIYRVTDSGWSVINRTQSWLLATFAMSLLALVATTLQLWQR